MAKAVKSIRKQIKIMHSEISCFNSFQIQENILPVLTTDNIIIDLSEVVYIDSSGVGMLMKLHTRARENFKSMKFINMSKNIVEILTMLGLINLFTYELNSSNKQIETDDRK